ncbi:Nn.00g061510.m01.CDS01 [Neocucurbitaria sp. VM-36]
MKTRVARLWAEQLLARSAVRSSISRPSAPFLRNFFNSAQPSARSRLSSKSLEQSALLYFRYQRSTFARRFRSLRFKSDKSSPQHHDPTPHLGSPEPAPSLSQRLKQLSREYGWAALGVYLGLSLIDFPFCFLAVRLLGTDRIGHYEDIVKNAFWSVVRLAFPDAGKKSAEAAAAAVAADEAAEATLREGNLGADSVTVNAANASIWTQLGLAYIVHKSLIFFRVPLTAAVLPKVVKTLRKWGYDIGKKKPKPT